MRKVASSGRTYRVLGRVAASAVACSSTWIHHPVLARVLGFNCAVHLTGIYSQAVQAMRLVAIRLSRSPIIMTHFVAVPQRTANSRSSLPILDDVPRPMSTFHVRRPTHPAAGCSIFACLLFCLRHFDFLIRLVAFCIHLPLHFICPHCITLSGISSGYPRPRPSPAPFFTPALAALLTIAAPATARQNYLLGKIKTFALLCGAEGVGWNGRVSQTRESLKVCQGHSAPTCLEPPPTTSWRQIREIIAEKENSAANIV